LPVLQELGGWQVLEMVLDARCDSSAALCSTAPNRIPQTSRNEARVIHGPDAMPEIELRRRDLHAFN